MPLHAAPHLRQRRRAGRGVSLVEALVAMAVMSIGMLALVGVQSAMRLNSDLAKQRTEATRIASEEIETLLSDVMMLDEGKLVLNISLEAMDSRFVALSHDASAADAVASAHPLLRYRQQGRPAALFDGEPPEHLQALGQRFRPSLVDLFMALTRKPELRARQD